VPVTGRWVEEADLFAEIPIRLSLRLVGVRTTDCRRVGHFRIRFQTPPLLRTTLIYCFNLFIHLRHYVVYSALHGLSIDSPDSSCRFSPSRTGAVVAWPLPCVGAWRIAADPCGAARFYHRMSAVQPQELCNALLSMSE